MSYSKTISQCKHILKWKHVYQYNFFQQRFCTAIVSKTKIHADRINKIPENVLKEHSKQSRALLERCIDINQVCEILDNSQVGDTALYNAALNKCFEKLYKVFSFNDVDIILNKMKNNNILYDLVTYHNILKIYSRSGDYNKCISYFDNMVDIDRIKPNIVTFNRLIKCCRYANNIKYANHTLRLMKKDFNISPDVYTYMELLHLYSQVKNTDALNITLNDIIEELKNAKRKYSHKEFKDVIEAMRLNKIDIEYIETVFETMINCDIMPDEELLNKMLYIVISYKDAFRIVSYFDMLIELIENNDVMQPQSIVIRTLQTLIGNNYDFMSAYYFIDNCITNNIAISNRRVLSLYVECIKCTFMDLSDDILSSSMSINDWDNNKQHIMKLIENAKDLPAQLQILKVSSILNQNKLITFSVYQLYESILMSLIKLKIIGNNEQIDDDNKDDDDQYERSLVSGDYIVYDILNYWYDSYYITRDLWSLCKINNDGILEIMDDGINQNIGNKKIIAICNVVNWEKVELKTLLMFIMLERFGDTLLDQGNTYLHFKIKQTDNQDTCIVDEIINKLVQSYGDDCKIDVTNCIDNTVEYDVIRIDLSTWRKCINKEHLASEETDSDDDPIDRDLYLS